MVNAIHTALRGGLEEFDVHNTVGQSGLFSSLARLYPGALRQTLGILSPEMIMRQRRACEGL